MGQVGPDAVSGWGLLNAMAAAEVISDDGVSSIIQERTLTSGSTYSFCVEVNGTNPLIASISWTDPPGIPNTGTANLTTPVLVNDLDIRPLGIFFYTFVSENSTRHSEELEI